MYKCFTCKCDIPKGTERKWGKTAFKCDPCTKKYNAAKMARKRANDRGPEWEPKSVPRHAMLECNGVGHICTGCGSMKALREFPKNKETPCGYDPRCKECRHLARRERMGAVLEKPRCASDEERIERRTDSARRFNYIYTYNLTKDQFLWLEEIQNGLCFLCEEAETKRFKNGFTPVSLTIDHDHRCCPGRKSCGRCVRHLLCHRCNLALGVVESKPKLVYRFADYIDLRPLKNYPGEGNW